MAMDDESEANGRRRRLGVATYFVATEAEADELHELARLAGYKRLVNLVAETMDARREELRARYGSLLEQARALRVAARAGPRATRRAAVGRAVSSPPRGLDDP